MFIPPEPPSLTYIAQSSMIEKEEQQVADGKLMILNETQVRQQLVDLPGWITSGQSINQTYKFANFFEAVKFVNLLVDPSERAGHHPDISISYNKVTIHLSTHDAGGITQQDIDLAHQISRIARNFPGR